MRYSVSGAENGTGSVLNLPCLWKLLSGMVPVPFLRGDANDMDRFQKAGQAQNGETAVNLRMISALTNLSQSRFLKLR